MNKLIVVSCALLAIGTAASGRALVVRSVGPSAKSYPPGKALADDAKIALQPGDSITIVGSNSARTLRGPGTFPAAAGAQELAMAASRRMRFGATRSGDLTLNPSPWNVDVTQSGTVCVTATSVKLWRPDSQGAAKLSVSNGSGAATPIDWPAGKSTVDWPATVPISEGAEYRLALADAPDSQQIRLTLLPAIPQDAVDAAKALVDRGCQNQLDVLLEALGKTE